MKSLILLLHLTSVGIWLGCVLTEALFERALLGKGHSHERLLAELHKRVDLIVEIPAFAIVLITGALLFSMAEPSWLLHSKIMLGLIAIAANVFCVWLVFRRAAAAENGNWELFTQLDHKQHLYGAVVLFGILGTLATGVYLSIGA